MDVEKTDYKEECQYIFKVNNYYIVFYCQEEKGEHPLLKFSVSLDTEKNDLTIIDTHNSCRISSLHLKNTITTIQESRIEYTALNTIVVTRDQILKVSKDERKEALFKCIKEEFKEYIADEDNSICPTSVSDIILIKYNDIDSYWYFSGSSQVNYSLKIKIFLDNISIQLDIRNSSIWHLSHGDTNKGKKALIDIAKNFLENFEIYDSNTQDCSHLVPGMYPIKPTEKEVVNYDLSDGGW